MRNFKDWFTHCGLRSCSLPGAFLIKMALSGRKGVLRKGILRSLRSQVELLPPAPGGHPLSLQSRACLNTHTPSLILEHLATQVTNRTDADLYHSSYGSRDRNVIHKAPTVATQDGGQRDQRFLVRSEVSTQNGKKT